MDDEFNHGRLKDIFDFFILKLFSAGPLSMFELRRRVQPLCNYLDLVALHAGKNASSALPSSLQRLLTDGYLKASQRLIEHVGPETVYSLTPAGTQRLENETARQDALVSQFVEDAELDKSFQKFLNRTGSPYGI